MPYTPVHAPPRAHGRAWARWAVHAHMWACVWRVCECAWARGRVLLVRVRPRTQRLRAWAEGKGCRRELALRTLCREPVDQSLPRAQRRESPAAAATTMAASRAHGGGREPSKEEERQRWRETESAPATGAGPWQLLWLPPGRGVVHSERSPDTQTAAVRSWTPLAWRRCGRVL
jgi:hypothetical protein